MINLRYHHYMKNMLFLWYKILDNIQKDLYLKTLKNKIYLNKFILYKIKKRGVENVTTMSDLVFIQDIVINNIIPLDSLKDVRKNKHNFISLLNMFADSKSYDAFSFIHHINDIYAERINQTSNLFLQTQHYIMQIGLYIYLIEYMGENNTCIDIKYILQLREDFSITWEEAPNNEVVYSIEKNPLHEIYIPLSLPENTDIVKYVNKYISLLNLMESFYFNKMFYTYLLFCNTNTNK